MDRPIQVDQPRHALLQFQLQFERLYKPTHSVSHSFIRWSRGRSDLPLLLPPAADSSFSTLCFPIGILNTRSPASQSPADAVIAADAATVALIFAAHLDLLTNGGDHYARQV